MGRAPKPATEQYNTYSRQKCDWQSHPADTTERKTQSVNHALVATKNKHMTLHARSKANTRIPVRKHAPQARSAHDEINQKSTKTAWCYTVPEISPKCYDTLRRRTSGIGDKTPKKAGGKRINNKNECKAREGATPSHNPFICHTSWKPTES